MYGTLNEVLLLFGSLLFLPVVILVGIAHGLRTGIIAGTERALLLFREWEE
jgi:hypothetical protein